MDTQDVIDPSDAEAVTVQHMLCLDILAYRDLGLHSFNDFHLLPKLFFHCLRLASDYTERRLNLGDSCNRRQRADPVKLPWRRIRLQSVCVRHIEDLRLESVPFRSYFGILIVESSEEGQDEARIAKNVAVIQVPIICDASESLHLVARIRNNGSYATSVPTIRWRHNLPCCGPCLSIVVLYLRRAHSHPVAGRPRKAAVTLCSVHRGRGAACYAT
jgi:hypothetical protein